jgi:Flp pilus assembly protein TadG
MVRHFLKSSSGSTLVMFALALPAVLGAVGVAIDFATFTMKQQALQAAADTSALAGAKELGLASSNDSTIVASTQAYLTEALKGKDENAAGTVTIDRKKGNVKVLVSEQWTPFFAQFIGADITPVKASATASLAGESNICLLALNTSDARAIAMQQDAHLQANGCSVYSNSTNPNGIFISDAATMHAATICSAGGVKNRSGSTNVAVLTDCPAVPDPLASRPIPSFGGCDFNNTIIKGGIVTLKPGVYCGGIEVVKSATVTFTPGNYFLKDGEFRVRDTSSVTGRNVAFFLSGAAAVLNFVDDAKINLSGAETGEMAGLLFFNDPNTGIDRVHIIRATQAQTLTGTIYLPSATLKINPNASVGAKSAYTAIIVDKMTIELGPDLVLNTDYDATSVPVPTGIRSSSSVVLTN